MNHKQTTHDDQKQSHLGQNTKRFPINRSKSKHSYKEAGIIHRIGTDYVDLLQRDHTVVRVLTRHVKKIKWVDHHCRNKCLDHVDFEKACRGRDDHLSCFVCSQHHRDCRCGVNSRDRYHDSFQDSRCTHCGKHHWDCHCSVNRGDRCINSFQDSRCSNCGGHHEECHCGLNNRERFIHSYLDKHCSHCRKYHRDCRCGKQFNRIKDPVIPYCDDRIQLRLAGLTDSFQYKLFKHKGCRVVLELDLSEISD